MPQSSGTDDGFREIQLNGKQLVFLFMAATVVSVVIFLCGVLVGRGVPPGGGQTSAVPSESALDRDAAAARLMADSSPIAAIAGNTTPAAEPPPTPAELSYYDRLETNGPAPENLRTPAPAAPAPEPVEVDAEVRPPAPQPPPVARATSRVAPPEPRREPVARPPAPAADRGPIPAVDPQGPGYAVQVAALRARGEAETVAGRLSDKGYPAYVMSPADGAPALIYRVRVGKFETLREANQVAAKLEKEERFNKPWVIR